MSKLTAVLGLALALVSCGTGGHAPSAESRGEAHSALFSLDPSTGVETGVASPRSATCPGNKLPDQCGSWAGVELRASRSADKQSCDHDVEVSHCLCAPIAFQIPDHLPVTRGSSGWDWDKAELSFRDTAGRFIECEYRGGDTPPGRKHTTPSPDYVLDGCSHGYRAGQTAQGDWFELELGKNHPNAGALEVELRLGAPDVVNGVVQEQVFYASDSHIAGAALHVPRGTAPPFETFTLQTLTGVTPGVAIPNGTSPVTSVSYGLDVHSDQTDHFVFTPVAGAACPRIELPYDPTTLTNLLGAGNESQIRADQITTLTGLTTGASVLASAGPVTINLTQHTLSFCVEHLSFYLGAINSYDSTLVTAHIDSDPRNEATLSFDLVTNGVPAGSLPLLVGGARYILTLTFKNKSKKWDDAVKVVEATPTYAASTTPTATAVPPSWTQGYTVSWSTGSPVTTGNLGTATLELTAPKPSTPLNVCLGQGGDPTATPPVLPAPFGDCFSWDTTTLGGKTSVPEVEVCDGLDNDNDGHTDNVPFTTTLLTLNVFSGANLENVGICRDGVQTCINGAWVDTTLEVKATGETCNGKDDDCNGSVDDNASDANACGVCGSLPAETCNGKDDDCNGSVDDVPATACGQCGGSQTCGACSIPTPANLGIQKPIFFTESFGALFNEVRTFPPDAGWQYVSCTMEKDSGDGTGLLVPTTDPNCTGIFQSAGFLGLGGATFTISLIEQRVCGDAACDAEDCDGDCPACGAGQVCSNFRCEPDTSSTGNTCDDNCCAACSACANKNPPPPGPCGVCDSCQVGCVCN